MDWNRLNSASKYPSILTYHKLGEYGRLTSEIQVPFESGKPIIATEKINGANGRLILFPLEGAPTHQFDWVIGSREEILTARGDRIPNPSLGIVESLRPVLHEADFALPKDVIKVYFFEAYGGEISGSKEYTLTSAQGARLLDIAEISLDILNKTVQEIARWRDTGGQYYYSEGRLAMSAQEEGLKLVPRFLIERLPADHEKMLEFLKVTAGKTMVGLDVIGKAEGIVVRDEQRHTIAKIRHEDYERTLRAKDRPPIKK